MGEFSKKPRMKRLKTVAWQLSLFFIFSLTTPLNQHNNLSAETEHKKSSSKEASLNLVRGVQYLLLENPSNSQIRSSIADISYRIIYSSDCVEYFKKSDPQKSQKYQSLLQSYVNILIQHTQNEQQPVFKITDIKDSFYSYAEQMCSSAIRYESNQETCQEIWSQRIYSTEFSAFQKDHQEVLNFLSKIHKEVRKELDTQKTFCGEGFKGRSGQQAMKLEIAESFLNSYKKVTRFGFKELPPPQTTPRTEKEQAPASPSFEKTPPAKTEKDSSLSEKEEETPHAAENESTKASTENVIDSRSLEDSFEAPEQPQTLPRYPFVTKGLEAEVERSIEEFSKEFFSQLFCEDWPENIGEFILLTRFSGSPHADDLEKELRKNLKLWCASENRRQKNACEEFYSEGIIDRSPLLTALPEDELFSVSVGRYIERLEELKKKASAQELNATCMGNTPTVNHWDFSSKSQRDAYHEFAVNELVNTLIKTRKIPYEEKKDIIWEEVKRVAQLFRFNASVSSEGLKARIRSELDKICSGSQKCYDTYQEAFQTVADYAYSKMMSNELSQELPSAKNLMYSSRSTQEDREEAAQLIHQIVASERENAEHPIALALKKADQKVQTHYQHESPEAQQRILNAHAILKEIPDHYTKPKGLFSIKAAQSNFLKSIASKYRVSLSGLNAAMASHRKHYKKFSNKNLLVFVDGSKRSDQVRLLVIDLRTKKVIKSGHLSHGQGDTGAAHGYENSIGGPTWYYSNRSGTHLSSAYMHRIGKPYWRAAKNRMQTPLHGLDGAYNNKSADRGTVLHKCTYSSGGGRSHGCPAVTEALDRWLRNNTPGAAYYVYPGRSLTRIKRGLWRANL